MAVTMTSIEQHLDQMDKEEIILYMDYLRGYNKLSQLCFLDCVNEFTGRTVSDEESNCSLNCMEKFLKMNERLTQHFQLYLISNVKS